MSNVTIEVTIDPHLKDRHLFAMCPFCRGGSQAIMAQGELIWVVCVDCGAQGPSENRNENEAVLAWNRWKVSE